MKKEKQLKEQNQEMLSVNENIYDMFSVDELEQRLQMSVLAPWICGTHDNQCSPITTCTTKETCSPIIDIEPILL
jgi:hypothetical protein